MPERDEILAIVRDVVAANVEALALLRQLCGTPAPATPRVKMPELSDCERDILDVLRSAGRRLKLAEIAAALDAVHKGWSDRTVLRYLQRLREFGLIESSRQKPYGYVLTADEGSEGGSTP